MISMNFSISNYHSIPHYLNLRKGSATINVYQNKPTMLFIAYTFQLTGILIIKKVLKRFHHPN